MREMSYNLSKENSQQPKDIRGGEKKVMKKSLSAILSLAMAFSMFSSVAFGAEAEAKKTSADFDDLKDLAAEQKVIFDAMISGGIFDGVGEKTFGLKDKMNRAQFAKVAALIFDLQVDTSLKTSSFSDVKAEDPANGYALPYIEALKAAGLTDGYAPGEYNPAGEVTKQELATFLVRGLGWEAEAKASAGVSDKTVSDWAKGYVAVAIEKKILTSGEDGTFGGTSAATRDLLVLSSYAADKQYVPAGKVSVTGAKAVGAKTVEISFNKPVDTDKARFKLKKGTVEIATGDAKFSDDKKTATLPLTDVKVSAGSYSVEVTGLDAATVDKTTAEFTAEDEKVTKIDFVNASETVAKSNRVRVKLKASNQYGENASFSAGSYTVYADSAANAQLSKLDSGELLLKLDTSSYTSGTGLVAVNIYHNETRVTATKTFKVGTEPFISKMELGAIKYSNGKDSISTKGETATFDVVNYDQYGNIVPYSTSDDTNTRVVFNGYEPNLDYSVGDTNSDDIADVKIFLKNNIDKPGDFTFTVYNQAGTSTGTVKLTSGKVAVKVELGDVNNVIAAGDKDAYVPITAYDADGNALSIDDLTNTQNKARIKLSASSDTNIKKAELVTVGEHKGKIKIPVIPTASKSILSLTAYIAEPNANSTVTKQFTIADVRVPESFKVVTDSDKKIIAGGESKFKIQVFDQYGKELKNIQNTDGNGGVGTKDQYSVTVTAATYKGVSIVPDSSFNLNVTPEASVPTVVNGTDVELFNKEHKFVYNSGAPAGGYAELKAEIKKNGNTINSITKKIEAIGNEAELTYNVAAVSDIFNAIDASSVYAATYDTNKTLELTEQESAGFSKFAKQVKITATDSAGNTVAIPQTVQSITSSNQAAVRTDVRESTANGVTIRKGYVIGNKKGSAQVNVSFINNENELVLKTLNVNVLDDNITSTKIEAGNTTRTLAQFNAQKNAFVLSNLKVTDNYGVTYEGLDAQKYNYLFGVVWTVKGGDGKVTVDQYGNITADPSVTGFDLIATTATGLQATTSVGE
ncbi:S-layer homology domain-containing protein [Paenibacillus sp. tmac-D7]|uniref:S-layer homology domain-containing protein n=1 Tax=Paenibacillus sp. tmac-D7 TaxID=2591462 RepID=UPI00215A5F6B|nr:S-layer homology domain-containing protein [Paenibacillus sp. tmac-D7]